MTINGHKPNRAERRRNQAERTAMARDNLRLASQAVTVLARFGQVNGIADEEQSQDFLFATVAIVIGTVATHQQKKPAEVLQEFCDYVRRLDPNDPTIITQ